MAYYGVEPSRLGLDSTGSAGNEDLFLKVFSGEVLTTFEANNLMMPLHRVRTIASGKSAQFPTTGVASATYHIPGDSLFADESIDGTNKYASQVNHAEIVISIDGVLTSSAFIADIDEAKNHYEVRSIYSTEIGRQLAYTADKNLLRTVIASAQHSTDRFGTTASDTDAQIASPYLGGEICLIGTAADASTTNQMSIGNDVAATTGPIWVQGIAKMAELMDSKNVPSEGRYVVLPPSEYYLLVNGENDAINRDYNDANGSIAKGEIVSVSGVRVLKSNHVPQTNEAAASNVHNHASVVNDPFGDTGVGYGGFDFSDIVGCGFQSEGVGTVKLLDLAMESEYYMERLGTMLMARYAMGHGALRNECLYSFSKDITT